MMLKSGGKYVSILSWNLFGLEELYRYRTGAISRDLVAAMSLVPAAVVAPIFPVTAWLVRSPRLKTFGVVVAVVLALCTVLWIPNPWEGM
jgi:hypothetical protein